MWCPVVLAASQGLPRKQEEPHPQQLEGVDAHDLEVEPDVAAVLADQLAQVECLHRRRWL